MAGYAQFILASTFIAIVFCGPLNGNGRVKRQLSPATALESDYLSALYGYEGSPFKRSPIQAKRQLSPSYEVALNAGNLRNLMDIGKRQVSMVNDMGNQFQMYNHLFDAGKKKRSGVISPAYAFESSLGLSDALEKAGRR